MSIGIYKITNLSNNKFYIGQSINIEKRWIKHKQISSQKNSNCYDYPLYRAIRKYGIENFKFEIVELCEESQLNEKEIYWIYTLNSTNNDIGYNICNGGNFSYPIKLSFEIVDLIINEILKKEKTQQQIAEEFDVSQRMISSINLGQTWRRTDLQYPLRESLNFKRTNYCIDCGIEISSSANRCNKCNQFLHRKTERPSRIELKNLIRSQSFVSIGKQFGVSDNAVRKWCKSENLPYQVSEIKKYSNKDWDNI